MANKQEVVYAFIDSQNLNLSVKNDLYDNSNNRIYKGWRLDFERFYIYLHDKYKVREAYLFIGYVKKFQGLYSYLKKAGYKLVFKPTLQYNDTKKTKIKGNVDAELVMHTMMELPNYDKAIIVAGDGDYHCLINYLISINRLSKLLIPNKYSFSSLLRKFRPHMAYICDLKSKLEET